MPFEQVVRYSCGACGKKGAYIFVANREVVVMRCMYCKVRKSYIPAAALSNEEMAASLERATDANA